MIWIDGRQRRHLRLSSGCGPLNHWWHTQRVPSTPCSGLHSQASSATPVNARCPCVFDGLPVRDHVAGEYLQVALFSSDKLAVGPWSIGSGE